MKHFLIFDSKGTRFTKEFDSEVQRNRYVDQVVLPQYAFVTMPPIVMRIGQILFVGDEYPESANDSSLWGNDVQA